MPNKHKNPMLGWRPPAGLSAWVRAEAKRRGVDYGAVLTEALDEYRILCELRGTDIHFPEPEPEATGETQ